jgi:hypothetical protein
MLRIYCPAFFDSETDGTAVTFTMPDPQDNKTQIVYAVKAEPQLPVAPLVMSMKPEPLPKPKPQQFFSRAETGLSPVSKNILSSKLAS